MPDRTILSAMQASFGSLVKRKWEEEEEEMRYVRRASLRFPVLIINVCINVCINVFLF